MASYKGKIAASKKVEGKPNLDVFKILGNILVDKDKTIFQNHLDNELFEQAFDPFMIVRYLSMNSNPHVRQIILDHQEVLEHMADKPELMYKLLLKIVPKTYSKFTPYIKSGFPRRIS